MAEDSVGFLLNIWKVQNLFVGLKNNSVSLILLNQLLMENLLAKINHIIYI